MGGNWTKERSRGATRHPEKRKGTRKQLSVVSASIASRTPTHREVGKREGEGVRDERNRRPPILFMTWYL